MTLVGLTLIIQHILVLCFPMLLLSLSLTNSQASYEIMAPLPPFRYPQCSRKSSQLPDFFCTCYSSSFFSNLTIIHSVFESISYKEEVIEPFGSNIWLRNLLLYIKQTSGSYTFTAR